ncbi:MAG: XRE family transcriptional regulator [Candidatus Desulfaltia sp.]|nr:XRE family transcriptional regulator [Candidatus Desulfaltia sp.]
METKKQKSHINVDFFEDLTGDISTSKNKGIEDIGKKIKSLREEKGLSIDEVSKLTGFDSELLTSIEKNEVQPQLGTVIKLSKALDGAFSRLVSGVGDRFYSVTRKDDQKIVSKSTSKKGKKKLYTYRSLAPEVKGRHMEAMIVKLEENPEKELSVHDGEEFIYIIDGVAALKIGEEYFDLKPGDSVYYLSTVPHQITSKKGQATILAVLYEG